MDFVTPLFVIKLRNLLISLVGKIICKFSKLGYKICKAQYFYFEVMFIIGYTQRLQFELNPNFVLFNRACDTETKTKNIHKKYKR